VTKRGGKGVINIDVGMAGKVVAAFPVAEDDEIMLVTDGGQLIRCAVHGISKVGRGARGVRIFRLAEGGRVVSVAHLGEAAAGDDEAGDADEAGGDDETGSAAEASPEADDADERANADGNGEEDAKA
jgi:DNA gyrase subunit A